MLSVRNLSDQESDVNNHVVYEVNGRKLILPPGSRIAKKGNGTYTLCLLASELQKVWE